MSKNIEKKILSLVDKFVASNKKEKFIPGKTYISCSGKVIDSDEIKNIVLSALDGWLTTGRFNELFEKTLASRIPIKNLITVNSGSSANLCAFSSLTSEKLKDKAIKYGDEVITVAAGFPTTVNPIIQNNAIPVFVDVKLGNYNILIENIEQAII